MKIKLTGAKKQGSYVVQVQANTICGPVWLPTHAKPFALPATAERELARYEARRLGLPLRILNHGVECELYEPQPEPAPSSRVHRIV